MNYKMIGMMKKIRSIGSILLGLLLFTACYEDLGNYDYEWIAEAEVKGLRDTLVGKGEVLRLEPEISWSKEGEEPESLSYLWTAVKMQRGQEPYEEYILGHEKILNDTIWLDIRKEPYLVTLTVRDDQREIEKRASFQLIVEGRIAEGFLFLTEDAGRKVELDIYARKSDGEKFLEKGVLGRSGFPYTGGGANCIVYKSGVTPAERQIWIATGEATGYIDDFINFKWKERNLAKYLFLQPQPVSYTFKNMVLSTNRIIYFFTEKGEMHGLDAYGIIGTNAAIYNNTPFTSWPGCGVEMVAGQSGVSGRQTLVYDREHSRFLSYVVSGVMATCKSLPSKEAAEGMELIFMQSVLNGKRTIALMKDVNGKLWRYHYVISTTKISLQSKKELLNPVGLEQACEKGLVVCDNANGYIYYAVGNQLYNYRESEGGVAIGEPLDSPVTCMKTLNLSVWQKPADYKEYNKCIIVATYSEELQGTARLFIPDPQESKILNPLGEPIPGLGNVKSISYLEK